MRACVRVCVCVNVRVLDNYIIISYVKDCDRNVVGSHYGDMSEHSITSGITSF
jgi:hypothetical protein